MEQPFLSIIYPAHNEEMRLPDTLQKTAGFVQAQSYPVEVLVVENGSSDRTLQIAQDFASRYPFLRVMHMDQPGKGRAVRAGVLAAQGQYRFFADVDLSMPIEEVKRFIPPHLDAPVVIASREAPGSVRYNEPNYRHLTGRAFNALVRILALPGLQDTQCGFKCFRADVAAEVFPLQTIEGWTFDVEVLYIARRRGYKIVELPIPWYFDGGSKIKVLRHSWRMFTDLLAIRRNGWRGVYDAPKTA